MRTQLIPSADLPVSAVVAVGFVLALTTLLQSIEWRRQGKSGVWVWLSGFASTLALCLAVLRPTWVTQTGIEAPPRVVVLLDGSHRLTLPGDNGRGSRADVAKAVLARLKERWKGVRLELLEFGEGALSAPGSQKKVRILSDLSRALSELLAAPGEKPRAIVIVSDGRLSAPGGENEESLSSEIQQLAHGVPLHTVRVAELVPADLSIREVGTTGTALAHQPFRLQVGVGCEPRSACRDSLVVVSELIEGRAPRELSRGMAHLDGELLRLELEVTLERAGGRVLQVALGESGDELPENDARLLPIQVRRDRTRLLHVAGRPTYDVRALRQFLKADESIDLISFFILRTEEDDVRARQDELALIPFPVDELFTEHLPSFDAIVLQDIDAHLYKLDRHFQAIRRYVLSGGGLILVGGPAGFSAGGYADSPIEDVLPVSLTGSGESVVLEPFVPEYTVAGRAAPVLWELRDLLADALPEMSGYNVVGPAKPQALVLWQHPKAAAAGAQASVRMPLLSLAEVGDGRSIALAVDGTHKLRFGQMGARVAGEGHGALWEGLLGWLMRDPRFEAARPSLEGPCVVGYPTELSVTTLPGAPSPISLQVTPLRGESGASGAPAESPKAPLRSSGLTHVFELAGLEQGGYAGRVSVGSAPPTRVVFACEVGGEAYADSRPDAQRLKLISRATGGVSVTAAELSQLPEPPSTFVATQRSVRPVVPAWVWSTLAALLLGLHWLVRRSSGLL